MGEANRPRAISPATGPVEALGAAAGQPATAELRLRRLRIAGRVAGGVVLTLILAAVPLLLGLWIGHIARATC